jgi:hypothetical protein
VNLPDGLDAFADQSRTAGLSLADEFTMNVTAQLLSPGSSHDRDGLHNLDTIPFKP